MQMLLLSKNKLYNMLNFFKIIDYSGLGMDITDSFQHDDMN